MTAEQLAAITGVTLSLLFSYVPGLREMFAKWDSVHRSLAMAVMLLVVAAGSLALSCALLINVVSCSQNGVMQLISTYIAALVANQATFVLSPQVKGQG